MNDKAGEPDDDGEFASTQVRWQKGNSFTVGSEAILLEGSFSESTE